MSKKAIVYGPLFPSDEFRLCGRAPRFWAGEVERGFDAVFTDDPDISAAYTAAGFEVRAFSSASSPAETDAGGEVSEPEVPEVSALDALREEASELDVEFDGRWGAGKLAAAIEEAKAENESK